jgi:hypothetical protein
LEGKNVTAIALTNQNYGDGTGIDQQNIIKSTDTDFYTHRNLFHIQLIFYIGKRMMYYLKNDDKEIGYPLE